jgi:O-antigen/teichoic acid export membrane protein
MIVIFFLIFSEKITLFFFKNYSSSIIYSIELLFRIGLIQVFFYPLSSILKSALICHDKIFIPLIINVIVPLTSLLGLLISFWLGNESMILIVFFQSLVSVLSFLILFIHFRKIFSLNFDPSFSDKEVKGMMINSFSMRFSGSIYTLGNTYLLTSIFGHSSPSVFALYGYIDKMWNALFSAVVTSLQSVGIPKISNLVNKREKKKLDEYCHAYYKSTIGPLLMFFVVLILILSTLLFTELYDLDRSVSVQTVLSLFSVLFLYKLINLFLSVPVIIIQSLRMTYPFLVVNIIIFLLGFMYTIISSNVVGLIAFLTLIEFLSYFYFRIIVKRVFIT